MNSARFPTRYKDVNGRADSRILGVNGHIYFASAHFVDPLKYGTKTGVPGPE